MIWINQLRWPTPQVVTCSLAIYQLSGNLSISLLGDSIVRLASNNRFERSRVATSVSQGGSR
jgi:hypothetical protein